MAKKKSKKPEDLSTVRAYKYFTEVRDCLQSGWSAPKTREYMIELHGLEGVPHEKAISRWREKHLDVTRVIVPHQIITRKLKGIDYKVDVIGHLSRLIALCEDRVGRGMQSEETDFGGMPVPGNDGVIQVYLQVMAQYVKVAQDLGIMKAPAPSPFLIDASTKNLYVTPETLKALQETVREIKMIEQEGVSIGD